MIHLRSPNGPAIRDHDGNGRLIAAGYQWDEFPHMWLLFIGAVLVSSIYLCVVNSRMGGVAAALPFVISGAASIAVGTWFWECRRTIVFRRDGSVLAPNGLPNRIGVRRMRIDSAAIASIEVTRECEGAGVAIYPVDGETFAISHKLKNPAARLVAVQLTRALRELRESMSTVENFRMASDRRAQPAWVT